MAPAEPAAPATVAFRIAWDDPASDRAPLLQLAAWFEGPSPVQAAGGPRDDLEQLLDRKWRVLRWLYEMVQPEALRLDALSLPARTRRVLLQRAFAPFVQECRAAASQLEAGRRREQLTPRQRELDAAIGAAEAAFLDALEAAWTEPREPAP